MRSLFRRWRLWLLAAVLLVGAVALACALAPGPSSGVTEANFQKIQVGMTPAQVDEILGPQNVWIGARSIAGWKLVYQEEGGDVAITAEFVGNRVTGKRWQRGVTDKRPLRVPQTLGDLLRGQLAKIRRRLGL